MANDEFWVAARNGRWFEIQQLALFIWKSELYNANNQVSIAAAVASRNDNVSSPAANA